MNPLYPNELFVSADDIEGETLFSATETAREAVKNNDFNPTRVAVYKLDRFVEICPNFTIILDGKPDIDTPREPDRG